MVSRILFCLATAFAIIALISPVQAEIPQLITYQGVLTDAGGDPVPDGAYTASFNIYTDSTTASAEWSEVQVFTATDGRFTVFLGQVVQLQESLFNTHADLFVGMKLAGEPEMLPRSRLTAASYAYHAASADTAQFAEAVGSAGGWIDGGATIRLSDENDKVGLGTDNPTLKLAVKTSGQAGIEINGTIPTLRFIEADTVKWDILHEGPTNKLHFVNYPISGPVVTIDDHGWMGLGIESPNMMLSLRAPGENGIEIDAAEPTIRFREGMDVKWDIISSDPKDMFRIVSHDAGGPVFTIRPDGRVGIGTVAPLILTHIQGSDISMPATALLYDQLVVEDEDATLGLYSGTSGSSGSGISLGEISGGSLFNKWSILRETSPQGGGLLFTFGEGASPFFNRWIMYLDDEGALGVGDTPDNPLEVAGVGSDYGGASGWDEVVGRFRQTGANHAAISIDGMLNRDAIIYFAENGEAMWSVRHDESDKNKFQLRYHGGVGQQDKPMTVDTLGKVGIGTASPNYTLDVRGTIGNNTTLYHSDERWKTDIETISDALEKVVALRGVNFKWRNDEFADMNFPAGKHHGVIAQEVEQVVPELVHTAENGFKSIEYAKLAALFIEAIKEIKIENNELRSRVSELESRAGR